MIGEKSVYPMAFRRALSSASSGVRGADKLDINEEGSTPAMCASSQETIAGTPLAALHDRHWLGDGGSVVAPSAAALGTRGAVARGRMDRRRQAPISARWGLSADVGNIAALGIAPGQFTCGIANIRHHHLIYTLMAAALAIDDVIGSRVKCAVPGCRCIPHCLYAEFLTHLQVPQQVRCQLRRGEGDGEDSDVALELL